MNRKNLDFLSPLDFFTKETLRQMEPDEDALDFNIKSWIKSGKIISLKKGTYLLRERWEKQTNRVSWSISPIKFINPHTYPENMSWLNTGF